jgi:hypothetical protein
MGPKGLDPTDYQIFCKRHGPKRALVDQAQRTTVSNFDKLFASVTKAQHVNWHKGLCGEIGSWELVFTFSLHVVVPISTYLDDVVVPRSTVHRRSGDR